MFKNPFRLYKLKLGRNRWLWKFKGKNDKHTINKGSWFHSQKLKNDEKPESSKRRGWTSNHKDNFDEKNVQCYNCDKYGHIAKDCWYNKGKEVAKDKYVDEAKVTHEVSDGSETMVFMTIV